MHHFLKETDFTPEQAQHVFLLAKQFKDDRLNCPQNLKKQSWGLLFFKSSTRTRISFEVGVNELGGFPIVLDSQNTQIGRGETIADTAKVMSQYLHGLVIRTYGHEIVEGFAKHATMPIVNGLTDLNHPCQLYTDIFTLLERYPPPRTRRPKTLGRSGAPSPRRGALGGVAATPRWREPAGRRNRYGFSHFI